MKSRGSILLVFVLFQAFSVGAQSKLVVNAPDSLSFLLFVDEVQFNTVPVSSIQVSKVNVGKHNVKVVVQSQESIFLLNAKNLFSHSFSVSVLNNKLELIPSGELKLQTKAFQFWKNSSIQIETNDNVYVGRKGCENPASETSVDSLVALLHSKSFDTERKMIARMQLQESCFHVKDIVRIISTIELEENRMDCIVSSLSQVYDIELINELLELVILERNKEALQQKISQLQNQ
ncbi:MAG: DUF4476 domain-containing protein [Sediminibacterium sp.]